MDAHLTADDGTGLSLSIVGYQFPKLDTEPYDSNWLMVSLAVKHPEGSWKETDPCLLTFEVEQLADWLEAVAQGRKVDATRGFTEPNLSFKLVEGPARWLVIHFADWPGSERGQDLTLPLDELDLQAAASSLRQQLAQFPQRAKGM